MNEIPSYISKYVLEVCLCDVPIFKDRNPTNHRPARFIQSVKKLFEL